MTTCPKYKISKVYDIRLPRLGFRKIKFCGESSLFIFCGESSLFIFCGESSLFIFCGKSSLFIFCGESSLVFG